MGSIEQKLGSGDGFYDFAYKAVFEKKIKKGGLRVFFFEK